MSDSELKAFERFAGKRGLYVLFCGKELKLYSETNGIVLATVYPDNWRVLTHFGTHNAHTVTSAFGAVRLVCDLLALEKAKEGNA